MSVKINFKAFDPIASLKIIDLQFVRYVERSQLAESFWPNERDYHDIDQDFRVSCIRLDLMAPDSDESVPYTFCKLGCDPRYCSVSLEVIQV